MSVREPAPTLPGTMVTGRSAALHRLGRSAERGWLVILLSVTSGAYLPLVRRLLGGGSEDLGQSALSHPVLLPLYAVMGCLIITHPKAFARMARRAFPALTLVGLACLSTFWSVDPGLTLRRGISLWAPTALGLVISFRFTNRELLRLLAVALGIAALASLAVVFLLPTHGIMILDDGPTWRGVFENKNSLGRAMALEVAVLVLVALDTKRYRTLAWMGAAATLAVVFLAKSIGSLIAALAVVMLIPLFQALRLRSTTRVAVYTVSVFLGAILLTMVATNPEPLFALLGRDTTLTGRTDIWVAALVSIAERPWLGYGHNAFWQGWAGPSMSLVSAIGWESPNSHNGLVDLWLELGLIGVLTFLFGLGIAARRAILGARRTVTAAGLWPLAFLTFLVVMNFSTSTIMLQHSLYWILYVAVMCSAVHTEPGERSARRGEAEPAVSRLREGLWPSNLPHGGGHISPGVRRRYPGAQRQ
jgi:exopolysaccharide production protein ExoQ